MIQLCERAPILSNLALLSERVNTQQKFDPLTEDGTSYERLACFTGVHRADRRTRNICSGKAEISNARI